MEVKLTDCYTVSEGKALMSGTEALVRLLLEQSRIDRLNGIRTKGVTVNKILIAFEIPV